jgi:hypothetical protein
MRGITGWALSFLVIGFAGRAQSVEKWPSYKISRSIDTSHLSAKKMFRDKKEAASFENNIAQFYLFKNGVRVQPPAKIKTDFFPSACLGFKFADTVMMNCGLGRLQGLGVGLKIFQDDFDGTLHLNSKNEEIFKASKEDSAYTSDLNAEPVFQSMKLMHRPGFVSNEIIVGEYNAVYRTIYKRAKKGKDQPLKYKVRVIFKCKVTGIDALKDQLRQNSN